MRVVFFGSPRFALPSLQALVETSGLDVVGVVTQPDRPRGRGQHVTAGPVKQFAEARGLPLLQPVKLAEPGVPETLAALGAELGVVAAYGKILPAWLLAQPRLGLINVHASLLPAYRGAAPVHRAILDGAAVTGVTIMRVVEELDAGPMLDRVSVPIPTDMTSEELEHALAVEGAALLVRVLERLRRGPVAEEPQDASRATYAAKITRGDAPMDWRRSARALHDQVRGLHPWPHATLIGDGRRVIVHRSTVPSVAASLPSGTVIAAGREGIDVACGDGQALRLLVLQHEGGRPLPAEAFQAGRGLRPGDRCEIP